MTTSMMLVQRVNASKGTKSDLMMSVQDIAVQSQALLNVKDSVKV